MNAETERLLARTTADAGGCRLWTGYRNDKGYGVANRFGRAMLAHRLVWIYTHGAIPTDLCVCHHCDTPACINPKHLFLATHQQNIADCVRKGRTADRRGEKHPKAKLTAAKVRRIRELYARGVSGAIIAKRFGLERTVPHHIFARKSWRHI